MRDESTDAFRVTVAAQPRGAVVLTVAGELDLHSRAILEKAVVAAPSRVVLDLRQLTFIDSAGIHVLVDLRAQTSAGGGWLRLVYRRGQQIDRVLAILGLSDRFIPYDDIAGALDE